MNYVKMLCQPGQIFYNKFVQLMSAKTSTKYKKNRLGGYRKFDAVATACQDSIQSIVVSALSFFAATFGVGLYSDIDMISSLCTLMARGALISMCAVILMLPSALMLFDKIIMHRYRKNLMDGPSAESDADSAAASQV